MGHDGRLKKAPRSPERAALQGLVGTRIEVHLKNPIGDMRTLTAYLRWVDMFTLGLSWEPAGKVFVVWKGALVALGPG